MFMMLSPMVLLFVAPIVLAGTRIPPGYMFAAFALWFLAVAAVAVRRDVCCTLHYQEGYRVFEVIGRTSDRERILEFVGRVLLRAQELKMTSEKLNKHLQPTPR
jgi:hypothetical protein